MSLVTRRLFAFLAFAAMAFAWTGTASAAGPAPANAPKVTGCGTIVTLNQTDHWVWITIYPLDHQEHYDWGWVAPHSFRAWHAGGAPTPMSYMCGSYYYVRYEVKQGHGQDGANLFDTTMQINPQLTLSDALQLLHSVGSILACVTTDGASCAAEWGVDEASQSAMFGLVGSEAQGSVVCVKSSDDTHFWLENTSNCAKPPPNGKRPPAPKPVYAFQPASHVVGIGVNQRNWYFNIALNGKAIQDRNVYAKGRFYTDNPGIARFDDPHNGHIHGVKAGKTTAHWDYGGKRQASAVIEVR